MTDAPRLFLFGFGANTRYIDLNGLICRVLKWQRRPDRIWMKFHYDDISTRDFAYVRGRLYGPTGKSGDSRLFCLNIGDGIHFGDVAGVFAGYIKDKGQWRFMFSGPAGFQVTRGK